MDSVKRLGSRRQRPLPEKAKRYRYPGLHLQVFSRMANSRKPSEQGSSLLSTQQNRATSRALLQVSLTETKLR